MSVPSSLPNLGKTSRDKFFFLSGIARKRGGEGTDSKKFGKLNVAKHVDGWMDLLVGAGVSTALRIVQYGPNPSLCRLNLCGRDAYSKEKSPPTASASGVSMEKI